MRNRRCMLALTITGIFVVALMLCASESLAMSGPPEGTHYQGPAIRGTFIFEDITDYTVESIKYKVLYTFTGTCGKTDGLSIANMEFPGIKFEDITEESLGDNVLPWDEVQIFTDGCFPPAYLNQGNMPDGLIAIQVLSFSIIGDQKIAEVVMLWVVP